MFDRSRLESFAARALPPFKPPRRPSSTAAGFFFLTRLTLFGFASGPVTSFIILKAVSLASSGPCLLERFGIFLLYPYRLDLHLIGFIVPYLCRTV